MLCQAYQSYCCCRLLVQQCQVYKHVDDDTDLLCAVWRFSILRTTVVVCGAIQQRRHSSYSARSVGIPSTRHQTLQAASVGLSTNQSMPSNRNRMYPSLRTAVPGTSYTSCCCAVFPTQRCVASINHLTSPVQVPRNFTALLSQT